MAVSALAGVAHTVRVHRLRVNASPVSARSWGMPAAPDAVGTTATWYPDPLRLASVLLLADAAIGLLTLGLLPDHVDAARYALITVVGAAAAALLPSLPGIGRWRHGVLVAAGAVYLVGLLLRAETGPVIGLGGRAVLAFVWLGLCCRPLASVLAAPVVLGVILLGEGLTIGPVELRSILVAAPAWIVVGETLARSEQRRRSARTAHRRAEDRLRHIMRTAPVGMAIGRLVPDVEGEDAGGDGRVELIEVNEAFGALLGRSPDEIVASGLPELAHPLDGTRAVPRQTAAGTISTVEFEQPFVTGDGRTIWVEMTKSVLSDDDESLVILQTRDITAEREWTTREGWRSTHDPLTGLPNRALLLDRLAQAVARSPRTEGVLAVLCSDLDHLNAVNDRYGHAVGDAVLVEAATRITRQLRAGDTAARLGGDEFVVVCEGMLDQDEAVGVARRIERAFLQPFDTGGPRLAVSVSVGVAVADGEMHSPDALLRDADQAMYRAKKRGRARYELSDGRVGRGALADLRLERELRAGLDAGELVVYYQPLVVPSSGRVTAVEALVRWRHPRRGLLLPQAFLEVAEASGLVPSLGHEVLRQACAAAAAWRRAGGDIELSVNISAAQLGRAELAAELTRVLKETGLPPAALWLEITEHALVEASGSVLADVAALKALGVRLAIDDFGTGYSSLTYLRDLPVDAIKVDRSFVAGVATDARDRALVASVVGLGRELGLRTVAEGVESAAHAQALSELGPDLCQGFYFGPPAPELPVVSKVG